MTTTFTYDDIGRLLQKSFSGGATPSVNYTYNDAARTANGITTGYEYDDLNRLTLVAALNPIGIPVAAFGYGHDPSGNRTQKNTLEHAESYKYDPLYRLNRADRSNPDESDAGTWVWRYDAVGNRTNAQANSETTTAHHNEKNQLFSMTGGGSTLWRGTLDEPGLVDFTSATVNGQKARMLPGNVFEANLDLPAGQNTVTIKARDGSGNESTKSYTVNVTGGAASYTYDANGNLETKTEGSDVWVYEWNAMNQLVEVKKGTTVGNAASVATFKYDPIGRRIEKSTPTKVTTYTYDGADILRENVTISGSTMASYYVHGPGIDEPLSKETGGVLTYYHADGLGSIAKETNGSGVVTATLRYDAWGNIETGARDGFAFTGREWDPETGLYYYRARYYDSRAGRFISEDPIGLAGGPNGFAYASANPISYSDPLGLYSFDEGLYDAAQVAAGFGDNLSFGLTRQLRKIAGTNDVINECSDMYSFGDYGATGLGLAFGGAHLGRNALYQAKGNIMRGLRTLASDGRSWGQVRSVWSKAAGGGQAFLKQAGQSLHHWLVPQRATWVPQSIRNSGLNYLPIDAARNSFMNGKGLGLAAEWGMKGIVGGIYGSLLPDSHSCGCSKN